jgi:predicted transcriptional regulator
LAAGQLFLMVNGYNSLDILREMGFETFDQDFDNHGYDLFTEFKKSDYIFRIDKLIDLLNRRYDQIEDIYFKNIEGIRYNQEYARSDQLAEDILAPLRKIGIVAK